MVRLIESGRTYARIRASWRVVQRAYWCQDKRYSRKCHLVLENAEPRSRPTFRKDFGAAVALAEWLFEHYESKQKKLAA